MSAKGHKETTAQLGADELSARISVRKLDPGRSVIASAFLAALSTVDAGIFKSRSHFW